MSEEPPVTVDIEDQQALWDKKHDAGAHDLYKDQVSELASKVEVRLEPKSSILEIGCGVGRDSRFFANQGHSVLATDFSSVAIEKNKQLPPVQGLEYKQLDISKELGNLDQNSFDVVYSHLALHYFDDAKTKEIFDDIHRILKPGGMLAFACKTPKDKYYGEGYQIGPDTFINNGHVRHFFSEEYVRSLVRDNDYDVIELSETEGDGNDLSSAFITCIAVKRH